MQINNNLAPIILFVYNRPWHTEQTLNALMQNELASESTLYIYCDGAKSNATEEQKKITEVREIVHSNQWCKEVIIVESENNKGLANSIIDGVSIVVDKFGKVIVLEDDIMTSPYFLTYMNDALDYYESYSTVFSISGFNIPEVTESIPKDYKYDVFVNLRFMCWGWGTWLNRWNNIDWLVKDFETINSNFQMQNAFSRGGFDLPKMLTAQRNMQIDSWAIRADFHQFKHNLVSILPNISYTSNTGFDGSGTNCTNEDNNTIKNDFEAKEHPVFLNILYQDNRIINSFYHYYYSLIVPKEYHKPIWKRFLNKLTRTIVGHDMLLYKEIESEQRVYF